jgi:hypothetical protein
MNTYEYTKRRPGPYDWFFIGLLILVIIILMTNCTKDDAIPNDCPCWLITDQGKAGEWEWFEIENTCSGRGDIVLWHESLDIKWAVGHTVCQLEKI